MKYAKIALRLESIQEWSVIPTVALHHLLIRFRKLFGARLTYGLSEAAYAEIDIISSMLSLATLSFITGLIARPGRRFGSRITGARCRLVNGLPVAAPFSVLRFF